MLDLLRDVVAGSFLLNDSMKLGSHFELTVMEDEERFVGADSHTIWEAFREWAADDLLP
jgi:hypothetical protein